MIDSAEPHTYSVAALPGDGIGAEVLPVAIDLLDQAAALEDVSFRWEHHDWSCERWVETGSMVPDDALDTLAENDAIFLGAVGAPGVPDHISLWGMLIPIRRRFGQFVNLRPVKLFPGVRGPVRDDLVEGMDLVVVRENNEGEYSEVGGRLYRGLPEEIAVQESIFTRVGVERVMRYAFELARSRRGRLMSATKSNGIVHTMPFWDQILEELAPQYADVEVAQRHIDALAATCVLDPCSLDVIVASNLFGDILSDITAAVAGSIGIAASGNIDPTGEQPSMFEPVHGSAPDIAGQGVANPLGQIWSGVLMLEHLGYPTAAGALMTAIERMLAETDVRTPDLGGSSTTRQVADTVSRLLEEHAAS